MSVRRAVVDDCKLSKRTNNPNILLEMRGCAPDTLVISLPTTEFTVVEKSDEIISWNDDYTNAHIKPACLNSHERHARAFDLHAVLAYSIHGTMPRSSCSADFPPAA